METKTLKEKIRRHWKASVFGLTVIIVAILLLASKSGKANVSQNAATIPSAAVVKVPREDLSTEITIPAEFRPYTEVELHAKVSGYLQDINVDFGDQVKAGQLLATIEIPELKDELDNAVATEQKAEADYKN